jgi:hypothetical protein
MGTAFTYQGQLKNASGPVDDDCDFEFSLWDAVGSGEPPIGGAQVGATQAKTNVAVSDGLFTIPDLDFGGAAFNGEARWLQIAVRCPTGSGTYATLAPRQALTPAPYALALPGLWTQQNAASPNLIGGYSGNEVADGVYGATIGGGGSSEMFCGPGLNEPCLNRVNGLFATVGGGSGNTASETHATIGGGVRNSAESLATTIGGGNGNIANGREATIGGGYQNDVDGASSTIGGGANNSIKASKATVGGGEANQANARYATVPGGHYANATHHGEMAYASGLLSSIGDAQTSVYVLRNETTDASTTELYLDGDNASERLTIASGRTVTFDILLVARSRAGDSIGCTFQGVIENTGGTTTFVQAPGKICHKGGLAWDANVVANDTNDALQIEVTGASSTNIGWVARVQTAEVSY